MDSNRGRTGSATDRGAAGFQTQYSRVTLRAMSADVKWIVGIGVGIIGTVIGAGLVLAGLMSAQLGSVSAQVAAVNPVLTT